MDGTFERLDAALRERPRAARYNPLPSSGVSPTPGPPRRPPELAANREDATATKRFEAGSGTCWWTPRGFRTPGRAPERQGHGSRRYCGRRIRRLPAQTSMGGFRIRREDRGKASAEKKLEWSAELLKRPRKPAAKSLLVAWAERWSHECVAVDWEKLLPPKKFVALPRRWVVERTFVLLSHNRKLS